MVDWRTSRLILMLLALMMVLISIATVRQYGSLRSIVANVFRDQPQATPSAAPAIAPMLSPQPLSQPSFPSLRVPEHPKDPFANLGDRQKTLS